MREIYFDSFDPNKTKPTTAPHNYFTTGSLLLCHFVRAEAARSEGKEESGEVMEERGGEGRSVSPGVFMSGWSVMVSAWSPPVPTSPRDTKTEHSNC